MTYYSYENVGCRGMHVAREHRHTSLSSQCHVTSRSTTALTAEQPDEGTLELVLYITSVHVSVGGRLDHPDLICAMHVEPVAGA